MSLNMESLTEKRNEIKLNDDCFWGNDLSNEENFKSNGN